MKIVALCNSTAGLPSIQALIQSGMLAAIGITDQKHDATEALRALTAQSGTPLRVFARESFNAECETWLRELRPDVVLVYTFPHIIPATLLSIPPRGFINFHLAPLPEYRGADPLFWLIRDRKSAGAVSVHQMTDQLDKGPMILSQPVPIAPHDTYGLHLGNLGMAAVQVTSRLVQLLSQPGPLPTTPQDESKARIWSKPAPAQVSVNWNAMQAEEVLALIRACNPWNKGAYTFLGPNPLRITLASPSPRKESAAPGTLHADESGKWSIACAGNTWIQVEAIYLDAGYFHAGELGLLGLRSGLQFSYPF